MDVAVSPKARRLSELATTPPSVSAIFRKKTKLEKKSGTWPQYLGNVSQMLSAIIAMVAVFFIISQVEQLQRNSVALKEAEQRTAARQVYMFYSQASLRYPEFAKPDYAKITAPLEQVRYGFFFAHMLFAYDEMLKVFDDAESII